MRQRSKTAASRESAAEQQMRDQEVLRANRELAAYFKGRRTEREARAALKIIKAFLRDRERRNPRPPLPVAGAPGTAKEAAARLRGRPRKARRKPPAAGGDTIPPDEPLTRPGRDSGEGDGG